jgi:hypothetical protein
MKHLTPSLLALALAAVAGCDLGSMIPKTADEGGHPSARLAVRVETVGLTGLPADLQDMKLQIVDVMAHRDADDTWVVLAGDVLALDLGAGASTAGLPVTTATFDRVLVALGDVTALDDTGTSRVHVVNSDLELDLAGDFAADSELVIDLDLADALKGKPGKWTLTPKAHAALVDAAP